ncbi:hypothetical protein L1887_40757 [Cichorium endivia]|nr:hypothetical protein L1887_40757 [Cichorium endivia]
MNIFIMNLRKHLVFLVLFTFNFLLHSSMASSQVQSFPPQNFTVLGDSHLRHGVAGLTLESNFLSASSGTITYTRAVRFSGDRTNSSASFSTRFSFFIILGNFGRIHSCMIAKDDLGKSDSEESANDALTALDGTTFDGTMIPVSKKSEPEVYEKNLDSDFTQIETFSENGNVTSAVIMSDADAERGFGFLSLSDDGLHDSRLSLSDDGLHDNRETTVGSFCTMSQILVHWRPTEEEAIYNYFISNIAAYVPTVQQKGERYISKVKALEAGKVAKCREDKKEKERRMKKEAFKMERERVKKEKEREMELNRKIKQEEMKKREADMAAWKKQREKEERAKKRKEEKRWRL